MAFSQFDDERRYFWACAIADGWQIILREPGRQREPSSEKRKERRKIMLFHLTEDPLAKQNLHGRGGDIETKLMVSLDDNLKFLEASAHLFRGEEAEIDPERLEQLRTLGYIQ